MADVKISALPASTTPLAGTEVLPIVQSSTTKQVSVADLTAGRAVSASSLTLTTQLSVANGGTGLTSLTAGRIPYGNGTGAFNSGALIVDSGNLLVGTTSNDPFNISTGAAYKPQKVQVASNANSDLLGLYKNGYTGTVVSFYYNSSTTGSASVGTAVGTISITSTNTAYNTSSDVSLKENISNASSALSSILSMPIRQFDWKVGGHTDYGVVAQEADEYAPEIVTKGDKWAVDYGRITPRLIKAFQELAAEVAMLKGQING